MVCVWLSVTLSHAHATTEGRWRPVYSWHLLGWHLAYDKYPFLRSSPTNPGLCYSSHLPGQSWLAPGLDVGPRLSHLDHLSQESEMGNWHLYGDPGSPPAKFPGAIKTLVLLRLFFTRFCAILRNLPKKEKHVFLPLLTTSPPPPFLSGLSHAESATK